MQYLQRLSNDYARLRQRCAQKVETPSRRLRVLSRPHFMSIALCLKISLMATYDGNDNDNDSNILFERWFFQSVTRDILGKINSECFQQAELMFFHSVIRMLYNWAIGDSSWLGHYSRSWCDKHLAVTPVGSTWNYFLPSMPASLTENFYLSFQSPGLKPTNLLSGVLFSEER